MIKYYCNKLSSVCLSTFLKHQAYWAEQLLISSWSSLPVYLHHWTDCRVKATPCYLCIGCSALRMAFCAIVKLWTGVNSSIIPLCAAMHIGSCIDNFHFHWTCLWCWNKKGHCGHTMCSSEHCIYVVYKRCGVPPPPTHTLMQLWSATSYAEFSGVQWQIF